MLSLNLERTRLCLQVAEISFLYRVDVGLFLSASHLTLRGAS